MTRIAVLTSGGDAPGMNAALRAVVKLAARQGVEVLGVHQGYEGLIAGRMSVLSPKDVDNISSFGGTILGSARSKSFMTVAGRSAAAEQLRAIDGLVVIGGNGSLAGALALSRESGIQVMGIPASIDNDIGCTATAIGVDTALNTIMECCDRISDTARAHRRVFIIEVMGRHCGYLAMASAVACGADACLFRERGKDEDTLLSELRDVVVQGMGPERDKKRVLILKAEGVEVPTERLVQRLQQAVDETLDGVAVRGTVLGHLVRGGSPSFLDRTVAARLAVGAVEGLLGGASGEMVAWQPWTKGGTPTADPSVQRFTLQRVEEETAHLLDGSSPVTQRRVRMMETYEGVLSL